jgi:hypothetical protein
MNFTQGGALPDITNTISKTTTTPSWYTDYLSGLASKGTAALNASGAAGASPLQQAAYGSAQSTINAGVPALQRAGQELSDVSGAYTPEMAQGYMNPYISDVVDEVGRLGVKNFNDVLAPGATAAAAGSGQFGSRRGMEVYGKTANDAASNILGQQSGALQAGYKNAMDAAQADKRIGLDTATGFTNLGQQAYAQGVGGLDVLSKLGSQQQATEQARLNQPMASLKDYAALFAGNIIPSSTVQTTVGPGQQGQYQKSAAELASLYGTTLGGLFVPGRDKDGNPTDSIAVSLYKTYGKDAYEKYFGKGADPFTEQGGVGIPGLEDPGTLIPSLPGDFVIDPEITIPDGFTNPDFWLGA